MIMAGMFMAILLILDVTLLFQKWERCGTRDVTDHKLTDYLKASKKKKFSLS